MRPGNIVLIGMPGAGKSTLGKSLASQLDMDFCDSDTLLENSLGCSLQAALDQHGYLFLRAKEAELLEKLVLENTVLATGGSAVYSDNGMKALALQAVLIYLNCTLHEITQRVDNFDSRGLAKPADQRLEALFLEREPLYRHYSEIEIHCDKLSEQQVLQLLIKSVNATPS